MNRAVDAERHRVAQLLDRLRRTERDHHRVTAIGLDEPDSLLDAALLVRAHRETEVARVDRPRVVCEYDAAAGDRHSLDRRENPHERMRKFSGSNSGVAPATATVTG